MNLPTLEQLRDDQSTYITFTKSLVDFDRANTNDEPCYFSKVVALNLPVWQNPEFYIDLNPVGVVSTNPNYVIPKAIQFYMENIMRQNIGINDTEVDEIAELAFYKLLNKMGLTELQIADAITFVNDVATSNFVQVSNNNGWGEIVCQIPNKCKNINKVWKTIQNVEDIVQSNDLDTALYDNGLKQFMFPTEFKNVLDFDGITYDDQLQGSFNFNTLLLFYKDGTGKHKLHGINFIHPFENKVTHWDLETFTQKTNVLQTIGYQFKFIQKTCTNEATQLAVQELQEHTHWNVFSETMGKLNSFLEVKMKESNSLIH